MHGTLPANGLTLSQAEAITAAARAKGRELACNADRGGAGRRRAGETVQREDGSSLLRPEIALGKAFGALAMGLGGRELARRAQSMQGFMNALSDIAGGRAVPVRAACCAATRAARSWARGHQRRRFGPGRGVRRGGHPGGGFAAGHGDRSDPAPARREPGRRRGRGAAERRGPE
jgi:uncharacterized protein GlcG (DUF336 family)